MLTVRDLLPPESVSAIRDALAQAQFVDGNATTFGASSNLKRNLELVPDATRETLGKMVLEAVAGHPIVQHTILPQRYSFPIFSKYREGMHYDFHTDAAILNSGRPGAMRTDLSCTVFLSDPESYEGGELTILADARESRIKLPAGSAVVYSTSDLHRVEPVTRGERLAAVFWIQSHIRDEAQRRIFAKLNGLAEALRAKSLKDEARQASNVLHDLLRMWAQV